MNHLRFLLLFLIVGQSFLFAQKDTIRKSFKPYGLIDAAPIAVNIGDFKPDVNVTIQTYDSISNLPAASQFCYYTFGDTVLNKTEGKEVSLTAKRNGKIIIVSNVPGYIWHAQMLDIHEADTSFVLKFIKFRKGDIITKQFIDINSTDNKFESFFYPDLIGLHEFLKLNPGVKIQMTVCSKLEEKIFADLLKKCGKNQFHLKRCSKQMKANFGTITIKILHI